MRVSDSIVVAATPDDVYALVSAPDQYHRWSPENTGADRSGSLAVGDRFIGTNRRFGFGWITESVVIAAEPGVRFAFRVERWGIQRRTIRVRVATWEYALSAADENGTEVTETWSDDRRMPEWFVKVFDRLATRGQMFHEFQTENIRRSLARLRDVVQAD